MRKQRMAPEAQRAELIPTNMRGVFAYPPLPVPKGNTQHSLEVIQRHGLLLSGLTLPKNSPNGLAPDIVIRTSVLGLRHIVPEFRPGLIRNPTQQNAGGGNLNNQESDNWCGYMIEDGAPWSYVSAHWTVPGAQQARYEPPITFNDWDGTGQTLTGYVGSVWVGIGGNTNAEDLLQAGMDIIVPPNGPPQFLPFYEWIVPGWLAFQNQFPYVLPVYLASPDLLSIGDVLYVAVSYSSGLLPNSASPTLGGTIFLFNMTQRWYFSIFLLPPNAPNIAGGALRNGSSVEWIVEQVGYDNGPGTPWQGSLPDFNIITFTGALGGGQGGPSSGPIWQKGVNLDLNANANGVVSAVTYDSAITPASVVVAYIAQPN